MTYKMFYRQGTVFCAFCAVFLLILMLPAPLAAAESAYTVEGVQVDVTAENALMARDKAFSQAQSQAFATLAQRLAPDRPTALPDPTVISTLIQDFEITQEKLSTVRYAATYTFRFQPDVVERFLGTASTHVQAAPDNAAMPTQNLSAAPGPANSHQPANAQAENNILSSLFKRVQSPRRVVLVIPYYRTGQASTLWAKPNPWLETLARTPQKEHSVNILTPIGDLQDLRDLPGNDSQTASANALMTLTQRYGADEALMATAQMMPNGALMVDLYAADHSQRGQIVLTRKMGQTEGDLLQEAALQLQDYLADDTGGAAQTTSTPSLMNVSAPTVPAPSALPVPPPGSVINAAVNFSSLEEWARVQQRLNRVPMLTERAIISLSTGQAILSLPVRGSFSNLQMALNSAGMDLRPGAPGDPSYTLVLLP